MLGPVSFFHNFIMIAVMMLAWAVIMAAFFILAVQLFIVILEFKLTTLAGFVLVPFALWNKTAFLAERVLGNVITSGVKLMVLAVIIGIGSGLFGAVTDAFTTGADVTLSQVMGTVLASLVFFWMGIFAPGVASGLITGAPQLGAGSAVGAVAGVGAGTYAAGLGARSAIGAVSAGAVSSVRAGAALTGATRTAWTLGSAASGGRGAAGIAGGLSGIAQAGGAALGQAAQRPLQSLRAAYQSGAAAAWSATGGTAASGSAASAPGGRQARKVGPGSGIGQAGQVALHAVREGDRGASGAHPSLKEKDD
jgi:type IV secretion system protein TrbL